MAKDDVYWLCFRFVINNSSLFRKKTSTEDDKTIKVGVLASITGPLESYGKQTVNGFELGLDYATGGTGKVDGKKIKFVVEDTETKADVAVKKATKLLEEEKVDFFSWIV